MKKLQPSQLSDVTPLFRSMEKLIEREPATRSPLVAAPALAVQFFLIPLAVVGITVAVYVGFRSLLADDRKAQDYLAEARISAIWALGSSGDPSAIPTLEPLYQSPDAGVRKMTVYALGALPGDTQL